jgi:hypothetical protein
VKYYLFLALWLHACASWAGAPPHGEEPIWLVGNTFHTSVVLRTRDVPFAAALRLQGRPDEIAFGWGARADYIGPTTPWTILQAIFPNRGAIQVVPVRGSVTRFFPDSDVVELFLTPRQLSIFVAEVEHSFSRGANGRFIFLHAGHYPGGAFFASRERFYFPYVCNEWVAIKLQRAGLPITRFHAVLSESLIAQAAHLGIYLQRHHGPENPY